MNPTVLGLGVVIANVLGAGMVVPQFLRIRAGRVDGVSTTWVGVSLVMNLWWTIYGVATGVWGVLPVSVVAGLLYVAIARELTRSHVAGIASGLSKGFVGIGVVPVAGLLIGGWPLAGLAIGLCYGVQFSPAAARALRSASVDGISPATWSMALGEAVIWVVYGSVIVDSALLVGGICGAAMASIILARLGIDRLSRQRIALAPIG